MAMGTEGATRTDAGGDEVGAQLGIRVEPYAEVILHEGFLLPRGVSWGCCWDGNGEESRTMLSSRWEKLSFVSSLVAILSNAHTLLLEYPSQIGVDDDDGDKEEREWRPSFPSTTNSSLLCFDREGWQEQSKDHSMLSNSQPHSSLTSSLDSYTSPPTTLSRVLPLQPHLHSIYPHQQRMGKR